MILKFDFKPLTFNQAYQAVSRGRKPAVIKTSKYRTFEKMVRFCRPIKIIRELEEFYDPTKHAIEMHVKVYLKGMVTKPKTKKDLPRLSLTALDVPNCSKAVIDALLSDTKINDAYICKYSEEKVNAKKDRFEVNIRVVPFDTTLVLE